MMMYRHSAQVDLVQRMESEEKWTKNSGRKSWRGNRLPLTLQKEWNTYVNKLMKISDKNKQKELLQKKLPFRLIGDNIFNALDITRGMVVDGELSMTVEKAIENKVSAEKIAEANAYIDKLLGIGG